MKILGKFIYLVLFFNVLWVCVLFSLKEGLHIDEQWSYGFSNSSIGGFFHAYELKEHNVFLDNWLKGSDIEKYFTVQEDGRFDYSNVYKNLSYDVHPPLYYYLLHTVCSFFVNDMSIEFGAIINIVFFVLSLFLLYKISKIFIDDDILASVPVLWYGFSIGGIDTFLYIRMYGLLVFWALMLFYCSLQYFRNKTVKYLYLIFIAVLGGGLTHFFFIVFNGCLTIIYSIKYLLKKEYRKVILFLTCSIIAAILLFVLFEPSLDILQKSSRAEEINSKLQNIIGANKENLFNKEGIKIIYSYFIEGGTRFFSHIWDMSFGKIDININIKLWASLSVCAVLCFMGLFYNVAIFLVLGFYLGIFFPEMWVFEGRYFMILLPFWCLFLIIFFHKILEYFAIFKNCINFQRLISLCLVFCFLLNMNFGVNSLYLFRKNNNDIKFKEDVKEKNVVIMFPEMWMFFETLYYVRGAKNIYAMMSSNRDNIKDKEYLGKDTLVLIMNHDSKNNLKLENKKTRELNKVYNDLEFLYIVQFSERFYDVYRVR